MPQDYYYYYLNEYLLLNNIPLKKLSYQKFTSGFPASLNSVKTLGLSSISSCDSQLPEAHSSTVSTLPLWVISCRPTQRAKKTQIIKIDKIRCFIFLTDFITKLSLTLLAPTMHSCTTRSQQDIGY